VGHGRAIVTAIPGTTRDTISESIVLGGIPVLLTDTAGLRTSPDEIESIGIDRTKREAADSDLVIVVMDGSEPLGAEDQRVLTEVSNQRHLVAINKSDLPTFSAAWPQDREGDTTITVSARTNAGLEQLRTAILQSFQNGDGEERGLLITNARHYDLLRLAIDAIESSEQLLERRASEEVILVGLHNALRFLGQLTGETTSDEILGQIFSTFCIGK
jgi:tRNA modification GTPase